MCVTIEDERNRQSLIPRDPTKLRRERERLKHNWFYEQNNNSVRTFVHFFAVPAQLRREMSKF